MRPFFFFAGLATGLTFTAMVAAAWTGPTQSPPAGNADAPVNVGTTPQIKNSNLGVNGLAVFGNTLLGGATSSNAYLNFGGNSGSAGYGLRDNAGTLEFKNSNGSWASLQSTIYNLGGSSWSTSGNNISNSNSGNVGIGTSNPTSKLSVSDGGLNSTAAVFSQTNTTQSNGVFITTGTSNAGDYGLYVRNAAAPIFVTRANGNVGIGTSNPTSKLSVSDGGLNSTAAVFSQTNTTQSNGVFITTGTSNAGDYGLYVRNAAAPIFVTRANGNVGIGTANPQAKLEVATPLRITRGDASGHAGYEFGQESDDIGLDLNYFDTATHLYRTIAIFSYNGNVGIGTRSAGSLLDVNGTVHVASTLQVDGDIYSPSMPSYNGDYYVCWVSGYLRIGSYCSSSDGRLKTDIQTLTGVLPKLLDLRAVTFNWKDTATFGSAKQIGMIAQEMEQQFPELVTTNADGIKALDYQRFSAVLLEGMKEQQTQIEAQQQEIDALKADIESLKNK